MLDKLKRLLGLHVHDFGKWETRSAKSSQYGDWVFLQTRICKTCGFIEFKKSSL